MIISSFPCFRCLLIISALPEKPPSSMANSAAFLGDQALQIWCRSLKVFQGLCVELCLFGDTSTRHRGSHQPMVQPLQPVVGVPGWTSSPRGTNAVALRPAAPSAEGNRMKLGTLKPPPALSLCLCMSKVKLCKCSFERHSVGGSKMSVRQEGCLVFYQQCPEMCCGPPWIQCGEFTGTHSTW